MTGMSFEARQLATRREQTIGPSRVWLSRGHW